MSAIRREDGVVVHDTKSVPDVWKTHFSKLGTPKVFPNYDANHCERVTAFVSDYNSGKDVDGFLPQPFSEGEVQEAIKNLHFGKSSGFDGVTAEHIAYTGNSMVNFLVVATNFMREKEYVPKCFKVGVQVPPSK